MKIYTITIAERFDGGDELITTKCFETEKLARDEFDSLVEDDKKKAESEDWEVDESDNAYESYESGYELENHYIVKMEAVDLVHETHVVRSVFGAEVINGLSELEPEDEDGKISVKDVKRVLDKGDGCLVQREFDTLAEQEAYAKGWDDIDGWEHSEDGEDFPFIPDEAWDRYGKES